MVHQIKRHSQAGFTIVEIAIACVVFPLIVIAMTTAFRAVSSDYSQARQFNQGG